MCAPSYVSVRSGATATEWNRGKVGRRRIGARDGRAVTQDGRARVTLAAGGRSLFASEVGTGRGFIGRPGAT